MSTLKLIDYNSPEKDIILEVFKNIPFMDDKWIPSLIENYIYSTVREYYPCDQGGSLNYEYIIKYGIRDGELKCWHHNSQLDCHMLYLKGKPDGEYEAWHDNGKLRVKGTIIDTKLQNYISFYKDGKPCEQSIFINDKNDCEFKRWYENGQLRTQVLLIGGKEQGECNDWYSNGQQHRQTMYINGKRNGEYKEWYCTEDNTIRLKIETTYVDGVLHGEYKNWSPNGELLIDSVYIDGVEVVN